MEKELYQRKSFEVEAVRVTDENMKEVVEWCGGYVSHTVSGANRKITQVRVPVKTVLDETQRRASVGDWVLRYRGGWKVYSDRAFRAAFDTKERTVQFNIFDTPAETPDHLLYEVKRREYVSGL